MTNVALDATISYAAFTAVAGAPNEEPAAGSNCSANPITVIYSFHQVSQGNGTIGHNREIFACSEPKDCLARKRFLFSIKKQGW